MIRLIFLVSISMTACGSNKADSCATPGSTYKEHAVQEASGTCGEIPDQVVNIDSSGNAASASSAVSCGSSEQNGCTLQKSDCTTTSGGSTCTFNSSLTFTADGASASGTVSFSCSGTGACISTYAITYTRQ